MLGAVEPATNMDLTIWHVLIVFLLGAILAGIVTGWFAYRRGRQERDIGEERVHKELQLQREAIAKEKAEGVAAIQRERLALNEHEIQQHEKLEAEWSRLNQESARQNQSLRDRSRSQDRKQEALDQREHELEQHKERLGDRERELASHKERHDRELERLAELTREQARREVVARAEAEARQEVARTIRDIEAQSQEMAEQRAREIITLAMERVAHDSVPDQAASSISLPSDDMKARIIGRMGRNIRSLEMALGVDIIVDDTPGAIVISCFDPIRREIARQALANLVQDGRIHPARIENEVKAAEREVDRIILDSAQKAMLEVGIPGLHRELQMLLGRLNYRTSYSQNQLYHAIETAHLSAMIAEELHGDVQTARIGGLLHDIGKAVSHEVEGPHAIVGAAIARRYGINEKIANCIEAHHHEVEMASMEAVIVATADAVSGARPGARRISVERYYERIKELEDVARGYDAVKESYALQAGRELRVLVQPKDIDDKGCVELGRDIAEQIHDTLQYPGQIKVTVIRETRYVAVAS